MVNFLEKDLEGFLCYQSYWDCYYLKPVDNLCKLPHFLVMLLFTLYNVISVILLNFSGKKLLLPSSIIEASVLHHSYPIVQGYFQTLFSCIENLISFLNVRSLVLPAADNAKSIWTDKFGFKNIPSEKVSELAY